MILIPATSSSLNIWTQVKVQKQLKEVQMMEITQKLELF